jgi:hypothetical protein
MLHKEMDFRETGYEAMKRIHLAQGAGQWRLLVNTVVNFRVPKQARYFLTS